MTYIPYGEKKQLKRELAAFERFGEGKARGQDFIEVARFMKRSSKCPEYAALSDRALAKQIQATNRLIEERAVDLVDGDGISLIWGDQALNDGGQS